MILIKASSVDKLPRLLMAVIRVERSAFVNMSAMILGGLLLFLHAKGGSANVG